ncbi:MAG: hypothetical protein LBG52_06425 [Candidatus Peribacteria bacterium]|nr:hypothetical protein [Candidatus Peribacteria bacterium]
MKGTSNFTTSFLLPSTVRNTPFLRLHAVLNVVKVDVLHGGTKGNSTIENATFRESLLFPFMHQINLILFMTKKSGEATNETRWSMAKKLISLSLFLLNLTSC